MSRYGLPVMFEAVFSALNARGVRYLIAGGVAVILHGHVRLTLDLDLLVDLDREQARGAVEALTGLGLVPRAPVDPLAFADPEARASWIRDRGMQVLTMQDPEDPTLVVDLFVDPPADFEQLWTRAQDVDLETTAVKVVSLDDLLAMKRQAGRPKDLLDVSELERIRGLRERPVKAPDTRRARSGDTSGGWDLHADEQRLHTLTITPRQRLEWLERALHFAQVAGVLPRRDQHR